MIIEKVSLRPSQNSSLVSQYSILIFPLSIFRRVQRPASSFDIQNVPCLFPAARNIPRPFFCVYPSPPPTRGSNKTKVSGLGFVSGLFKRLHVIKENVFLQMIYFICKYFNVRFGINSVTCYVS